MAGIEKFRPRGAYRRLAADTLARRLRAPGRSLGLGGQRGDALVEPGRSRVEVLASFADLGSEQPRAAQENVGELKRAPQVERDRQRAEEIQDLRRPVEPVAVRGDPARDRLEPVVGAPDRGDGRVAVQQPDEEAQHEGDDRPQDEARLAAIGPDRPDHDRGAPAGPEGRYVARQTAIARVDVGAGESEPAQLRLDRSAARAGEDVEARAGGVERQRIGDPRAFGLDLVALRALGFELPHEVVMAIGRRSRGAMGIAAGMAGFVQEARIIHPAGLAIERGIGGARDRHRRLDAVRGVDARQHDPLKDARRRRSLTKRRAVRSPARDA